MKKISAVLLIFIYGLLTNVFSQTIPIIDVRQNNSNGEPAMLGQIVTISGIVTTAGNFGNSGPGNVQDETAGISVYGSGFAGQVQIGDSVTVSAEVGQYNGLTELLFSNPGSSLTVHKSGCEIEPLNLSIADILGQAWNGLEEYEGSLIRLNEVTINASGNFSGNTNYNISDATGSMEIRIDNDVTSVINTPIPSGSVDVVGVLGQYVYGPPYDDGYQLLPRFIEDIITGNEPVIISPVVASNITTTSFSVYFNTIRKGNSEVRYGITEDLELGSKIIEEDTTYHVVLVDGLDPLTKYYFRAYSTNSHGTSESAIYSVNTANPNPSSGTINVYFNYGVDNSVAIPGNEAMGNVDFKAKVIERINSATYSIDIALYSFYGMNDIADAIVAAKQRGVKIRVVYDNRTIQSSMQVLLNNGIQMSQRPAINGIMHNKFAIIDGRDSDPDNDWVWTGSWNWTSGELDWRNNVIEINDHNLAEAYKTEFEEMWGSNGDTPNSSNAKFGPFKQDNTTHTFSIGGKEVGLYFSPSDNTENQIETAINSADSSIYYSLLVFTSNDLFDAIAGRISAGVSDVRGIIDNINVQGSEYNNLLAISEVFEYTLGGTLHHKYGMTDASYPSSDPVVYSGSHNWSAAAENDNDENTLFIHDIFIANQYMQEFKKRYNELGGTTSFVVPIITSVEEEGLYPETIELGQNYPNPFNPVTTITFFMPERAKASLVVYDMLGREVATIFNGTAEAGLNVYDFDAGELSSGLYIYRLKTSERIYSKKMMLLK